MYRETWYVKRTSASEPEKIVLFFADYFQACWTFSKAREANDARIFFGSEFSKEIASSWQ